MPEWLDVSAKVSGSKMIISVAIRIAISRLASYHTTETDREGTRFSALLFPIVSSRKRQVTFTTFPLQPEG